MGEDPFIPRRIKLHKMDAARRQLATAIELWFHDGDPVSVHTLAYAAHEILHVIFRRRGGKGLLFDNDLVKEEYKRDFNKFIKEDANFIKHAKEDFDATRDFNVTAGLTFITVSLLGIIRMNEPLNDTESIFLTWARLHCPHWFTNDISEDGIPADVARNLRALSKSELYDFLKVERAKFIARSNR